MLDHAPILIVPDVIWRVFSYEMLAESLSSFGLLYCQKVQQSTQANYVVRHWYIPPPIKTLVTPTAGHVSAAKNYIVERGEHPVFVRVQPAAARPRWTRETTRNEREYAHQLRFLAGGRDLISGTVATSLAPETGVFRLWRGDSTRRIRFEVAAAD